MSPFPQTIHGLFDSETGRAETLGGDAYELLSFMSVSKSKPFGMVSMAPTNPAIVDIGLASLGYGDGEPGSTGWANHSYEFYHDAVETKQFWQMIKSKTD